MACRKAASFSTELAALARVEKIWTEIRQGTREFRDHTPHGAVWCYSHNAFHLTSNVMKPRRKGKRGRLANGLRTNDRRSRSHR